MVDNKYYYDSIYFSYPIVDLVVPLRVPLPIQANNTYLIDTIKNEAGGPANLLIMGKRIGLNILPVGIVGNDYYGQFLLDAYAAADIDISQIIIKPDFETSKAIVLVDTQGEHAFVSMVEGAEIKFENAAELIEKSRSLCFSGYYVTAKLMRNESMRLLRLAQKKGVQIFFDPGPLIQAIPQECIEEIFDASAIVILNEKEAELIAGESGIETAAAIISKKSNGLIVVKAGPRGCYVKMKQDTLGKWYPGFPADVVDTTAAGDSFWAAFIYGYLSDWDVETIALFANAVGAAKVKKMGSGTQVPTYDEIVLVLENAGFQISSASKRQRKFENLKLHSESVPN